jgi:hypothetical protein
MRGWIASSEPLAFKRVNKANRPGHVDALDLHRRIERLSESINEA